MNVYLVGLRGSGKTTTGTILAGRLGLAFVDADEEVERRAGRTVTEIFARDGEQRFRELERDAMRDLLARDGLVVATGGGCVLDAEVRAALARAETTVWLDAAPEVRAARIAKSGRPLLTAHGGGALEELEVARAREPLYRECAAHRVETDRRTPEEVANDVERYWRGLPGRDVR